MDGVGGSGGSSRTESKQLINCISSGLCFRTTYWQRGEEFKSSSPGLRWQLGGRIITSNSALLLSLDDSVSLLIYFYLRASDVVLWCCCVASSGQKKM